MLVNVSLLSVQRVHCKTLAFFVFVVSLNIKHASFSFKYQFCKLWGKISEVITGLKMLMWNITSPLIILAFNLKLHECFLIDSRFYKRFPVIHLHVFDVLITKGKVVLLSFAQFVSLYFSVSWYTMRTGSSYSLSWIRFKYKSCFNSISKLMGKTPGSR